jgi:hypothetical protein
VLGRQPAQPSFGKRPKREADRRQAGNQGHNANEKIKFHIEDEITNFARVAQRYFLVECLIRSPVRKPDAAGTRTIA